MILCCTFYGILSSLTRKNISLTFIFPLYLFYLFNWEWKQKYWRKYIFILFFILFLIIFKWSLIFVCLKWLYRNYRKHAKIVSIEHFEKNQIQMKMWTKFWINFKFIHSGDDAATTFLIILIRILEKSAKFFRISNESAATIFLIK